MTTSLILQRFSSILENPEVLNKPEDFLGPNTEKLLEFWLKIDELSEEQLRVVKERDNAFFDKNSSEWSKAVDLAVDTAKEIIGDYAYYAGCAVYVVTNSYSVSWATRELIGGVENPVFVPMFDNL
jgi:hypothetical protein